jgi:hypothetical protein
MASQLSVSFASGADRVLALRKLQTIVDGAVATRLDIRALEHIVTPPALDHGDLDFPDDVPTEEVLACFEAAVNMAGLPESGFVAGTALLTGDVLSGSRQRVYSV